MIHTYIYTYWKGDDFEHFLAVSDFANMDQIMDYINDNPSFGVTVQYATLGKE